MKKLDPENDALFPLTPGPSPHCGEGEEYITVNSLAPTGGEGARRAGEGVVRNSFTPSGGWGGVFWNSKDRANILLSPDDLTGSVVSAVKPAPFSLSLFPLDSSPAPQKLQNRSPRSPTVAAVNFERLKAKADAARDADQIPEAIKMYKQLVRIRPRWAEGWWYLGTLYYDSDQYAPGAKAFQQFVSLEPKNGQGWAMLGLCEYQFQQYASSLQHLAKSRSLGFSGNEELARVVRYHQAILLTRGKQYEAAMALLNGFAVEHRESDGVLDALGLAALRIADPLDSLNREQREMVRQFGKASFLGADRKMPESNKMFQELEARYRGQPNVAYAYGVALLLQKEPEKAMTYFLKELERDPRHVASLLQIAFQAIASGKYTDGLPYANKAVEIEPDNFAGYYALGRIYLELDDIAQALKNLEKAAAIASDSSNVQFVLARAYTRAKRPAEAARARAEFARLEALAKKRRGEATGPGDPSETMDDEGKPSNP